MEILHIFATRGANGSRTVRSRPQRSGGISGRFGRKRVRCVRGGGPRWNRFDGKSARSVAVLFFLRALSLDSG